MSAATYVAAGSLDEALDALASGARPIAGGTDLVVGSRSGAKPMPGALVAIHALDELRALDTTDGLRAGALVSHATLAADPVVAERYTALADASAIVGSHATRAQGTIGGNVMNGSPAMDTGGPLLCLGGSVTLRAAGGATRDVALDALWTGPGRTSAEPGELLTAVTLPPVAPGTGSAYVRLEYRRQMEIAVVGATVGRAARGRRDRRRPRRDHRARADDPPRPGGRGGAGRQQRRPRRRRRGGRRRGRRVRADQRQPRLARLPPRDGRRHHPPRGRRRRRARPRRRRPPSPSPPAPRFTEPSRCDTPRP